MKIINNMTRKILLLCLAGLSVISCQREIEKFQRPDWLEGKLFTQIQAIPETDQFVRCLTRTGYDTIINSAGSFTVFVPNNAAFDAYFAANSEFSSVDDMPYNEVWELVRTHIIQNPWSRVQLQTLDINGWIDKKDPYNDEPWGYKRQTTMKDPNKKYFIKVDTREVTTIVDSTQSTDTRMVFTESRKYAPLFFDEYMELAKVNSSDYEYFFNRPFDAGSMYYVNAKLIEGQDEYAENGFIYVVDQVVEPLKNAEQHIESDEDEHNYNMFLETIHLFPEFIENIDETNKQPGAELGLEVPTLYNLRYPSLTFDIHREFTGEGRDRVNSTNSIRYHYGVLAPTDAAMKWLIDNILTDESGYPHWPNYTLVPEKLKEIIANAHMSNDPVYLSDIRNGFVNGEEDSVYIDESFIVDRAYGSNSTFMGIDKPIIPRAFSSVTGPVYLRPGYNYMMNAMEYARVLPAIKRIGADYSFFIVDDEQLMIDSSLVAEPDPQFRNRYTVYSYDKTYKPARRTNRSRYEMVQTIFNQVAEGRFSKVARKEFIKTLAGNYICYNSVDDIVTGGVPTNQGWNGDSTENYYLVPIQLEEPTDNGETYNVQGFFDFPRTKIYDIVLSYRYWYDLIFSAGLIDLDYGELTFINEAEYHTLFIPTQEALQNYNTDTLSTEELRDFIKYHFVKGEHVFTHGKEPPGPYPTLRIDESSTQYSRKYSTVELITGIDRIELYNGEGHVYTITENDSTTNILTGYNTLEDAANNPQNLENFVTNAVVHEIDTVLLKR